MTFPGRIAVAFAFLLAAGVVRADPGTSPVAPSVSQAVASRMGATGESYDQASRAVAQRSGDPSRTETIAQRMSTGESYDRAAANVAGAAGTKESAQAANGRWQRHLTAMSAGGAHEAGWAAAARN